jgi:hypothetical protein
MTDWILGSCRESVARERVFRGFYPSFLGLDLDDWRRSQLGPDFRSFYEDQELLLSHGKVVWGHLVQANAEVFRRGSRDLPAAVVFSEDPWFDGEIEKLGEFASRLFELKGLPGLDPELRTVVEAITAETTVLFNVDCPTSQTFGKLVYYTTTVVVRRHLPTGSLTLGWFPYLALPDRTPASMILPYPFWPDGLREGWREAASESPSTGAR